MRSVVSPQSMIMSGSVTSSGAGPAPGRRPTVAQPHRCAFAGRRDAASGRAAGEDHPAPPAEEPELLER